MHTMRLTNKQIQDLLTDLRKQLKSVKATGTDLSINFKLPSIDDTKARLVIAGQAWRKILGLVQECTEEIAWHGTVEKSADIINDKKVYTYTITDVIVFPQTVTGCTVTSDETEYSMWLAQQPDDVFNALRFHGHSHVNMGVSPSGVDTTYQEDILNNLQDFYIFAIFNKKGDIWCAIYDVEDNVAFDNKDIEIVTPSTENTTWAKAAIKSFVKSYKATKKETKKKDDKKPEEDGYDYLYGYGAYADWRRAYYGQE